MCVSTWNNVGRETFPIKIDLKDCALCQQKDLFRNWSTNYYLFPCLPLTSPSSLKLASNCLFCGQTGLINLDPDSWLFEQTQDPRQFEGSRGKRDCHLDEPIWAGLLDLSIGQQPLVDSSSAVEFLICLLDWLLLGGFKYWWLLRENVSCMLFSRTTVRMHGIWPSCPHIDISV